MEEMASAVCTALALNPVPTGLTHCASGQTKTIYHGRYNWVTDISGKKAIVINISLLKPALHNTQSFCLMHSLHTNPETNPLKNTTIIGESFFVVV